jgi:hypothetical protein
MHLSHRLLVTLLLILRLDPIMRVWAAEPAPSIPAASVTTSSGRVSRPADEPTPPEILHALKRVTDVAREDEARARRLVGESAFEAQLWIRIQKLWKNTENAPEVRQKLKNELEDLSRRAWVLSEAKWAFFGCLPGALMGVTMGPSGVMALPMGMVTGLFGMGAARIANVPIMTSLGKRMKKLEMETLPRLESEAKAAQANAPQVSTIRQRQATGDPMEDLPVR